jgi:ubiquinone/menaquinone biosynthesis C-methylase UbiE
MAWWESWFGEEYLELYPHRDLESARREISFALSRLDRQPELLLDLCCGSGRHSRPLVESGFSPVGLDYSAPLLEFARTHRRCFSLVRGDMRHLPFNDGTFRSVINFFTSFGYFLADENNRAVLEEVERVLAPRGRFLCDTFGLEDVLTHLVAEEHRQTGEREYRITRRWNEKTRRLEKEIEVRRGGSTETFRESVRGYTPEELMQMVERAGLAVEGCWGDFDGCPVGPASPRLILLASKR